MLTTQMNQWTLADSLRESARTRPDRTAVAAGDGSYTYTQLFDAASRLAHALREHGVRRGDRVVIFMDSSAMAVVCLYAAALADAVFVVLHSQMKADKLSFVLRDSGATALLTQGRLWEVASHAATSAATLRVIAAHEPSATDTVIPSIDALVSSATQRVVGGRTIPTDLAALVYTSGSTADPKGVMLTHSNMVFATESICTYLRLTADEKILCVLPLSFDYGLYQVLMAIRLGATVVLERSMAFPAHLADVIQQIQPTVFPGVPTSFAGLLSVARSQGRTFDSVTRVTNTAAALSPAQIRLIREIFPNALFFSMYGLTECKRVSYLEPRYLSEKPTSVGTAIPGTETLVLNERGEECAPNEIGVLHVRGPHVMAGYWNLPSRTAEVLVEGPVHGEKMLNTRDLFRTDDDGFLYFVSRTDEIIKTRGEKVSPLEVERVLHELDGVQEAAVVGTPDEVVGEAIAAYVVVEDDSRLTETVVRRHCRTRLEGYMVPSTVHFVTGLPKTSSGKISKTTLRSTSPADVS